MCLSSPNSTSLPRARHRIRAASKALAFHSHFPTLLMPPFNSESAGIETGEVHIFAKLHRQVIAKHY